MPGGPNNRPTAFIDAAGNRVQYTYDAAGNVTATQYADDSAEQIAYDALGNPVSLLNRRGQAISQSFNANGQLTQQTFPDGSTATYTYDAENRLATAADAQGTTTFAYDTADRLTRIDYPGGRWLAYTYDAAGRRTRLEDHSGFVVQYAYDAAGRLAELQDGAGVPTVSYTYDAAGRLSREDKGNGTYSLTTYDAAGREASIVHYAPDDSVNSQFVYTYDSIGRRTGMSTSGGDWTYQYDLTGQLTRAIFGSSDLAIPDQDLSYTYDAAGNRVRTVRNGATTDYTANGLNQITTSGETQFGYDLDGNLIEETGPDGTRVFTYDALNRLVGVITPAGTWQYEYDVFSNRIAIVVDGERTEFLLDPSGIVNVVGQYDAAGTRTASYTYGLGLESVADVAGVNYYDFSAIGSTAGLSGTTGQYVNEYAYTPFGETLRRLEEVENAYLFIGQFGVQEEANGLSFMRARYYDPQLGRFTSVDPLRIFTPNLYAYADNRPTEFIDPQGLDHVSGQCEEEEPVVRPTEIAGSFLTGGGPTSCKPKPKPKPPCDEDDFGPIDPIDDISAAWLTGSGGDGGDGNPCGPRSSKFNDKKPDPPGDKGDTGGSGTAFSSDPNEKFGASGFGPQEFIQAGTTIPYRINFENLGPGSEPAPAEPATAPAQRVVVTDQLAEELDWSTLEFTEAGFGDTLIGVPAGQQYSFAVVPMTFNDQTFDVEVELSFDSASGEVRAVFQSIDPGTFLPPDVLTGFLPPEDATGRGQGHIGFTVEANENLATGTEIRNIALIRFDGQTVIATNQIDPQDPGQGTDPTLEALNTIDALGPTSEVNGLPATSPADFAVTWAGADDAGGSGIRSYDLFVSVDAGPFKPWLESTTLTEAQYPGQVGHTYAFYSRATDNVGHLEAAPESADATTVAILSGDMDFDGDVDFDDIDGFALRLEQSGHVFGNVRPACNAPRRHR